MLSDEEFIKQVFDNQGIIHKACRMYLHAESDREELFQEIIYQIFKSKPSFRAESKLTTWLYQISVNTAITFFKKDKKRTAAEQGHFEENQLQKHDVQPQFDAMYAAIDTLSKVEKAIILLFLEDLPYNDIAEIVGITENHVAVKINRIKAKLKSITPKYLNDGPK